MVVGAVRNNLHDKQKQCHTRCFSVRDMSGFLNSERLVVQLYNALLFEHPNSEVINAKAQTLIYNRYLLAIKRTHLVEVLRLLQHRGSGL